jgi:hypothetical protein
VVSVDHPLDQKIPFMPRWVGIYLDFTAFWIRLAGFLLRRYGRGGIAPAREFIDSIGRIYPFAAEVYGECLSTTRRPRYLGHPRFVLIHGADPHLMCVPSLHVMVMIRSYTQFRSILRSLGGEEELAGKILEVEQGALAITASVLLVKQHSVNCVAAAMYAMSCFDGELFPPDWAEGFVSDLSRLLPLACAEDRRAVGGYMLELYRRFLREGTTAASWKEPLTAFLRSR